LQRKVNSAVKLWFACLLPSNVSGKVSFTTLFTDADVKTKLAAVKLSESQEHVVTAVLVFVYIICEWMCMRREKLPECKHAYDIKT
jgi:hypothetical protein